MAGRRSSAEDGASVVGVGSEEIHLTGMPPGGWMMFLRDAGRELFLLFTYDLQMFLPDQRPLLSFRASWPGHRRVFDMVSGSLGVAEGGGAHPWPDVCDDAGRVGRVKVRDERHYFGLAVGAEEAAGASMVGVVHAYPLSASSGAVVRLSRLAPGGTCFDVGARLVEAAVRLGAEGYPAHAMAYLSDGPQRLPGSVPLEARAKIVANATPWQREHFPRGRHYVEAVSEMMARLGVVDPAVQGMMEALGGLEG